MFLWECCYHKNCVLTTNIRTSFLLPNLVLSEDWKVGRAACVVGMPVGGREGEWEGGRWEGRGGRIGGVWEVNESL